MTTNVYFDHFTDFGEQRLYEELIIEAIQIYGQDMWYIPRLLDREDKIYGESDITRFASAHMVEMYIKSVDGFKGDGHFLSKFGFEIRDQIVFSIAQRVFNEEVAHYESNVTLTRPREGDLIYFPLNQKLFQIRFVNKWEMFYQIGALQTWELTCELFEYSSEKFETGIEEIDSLMYNYSFDAYDNAVQDEAGVPILDEANNYIVPETFDQETIDPISDNDDIQTESDVFVDFSELDPFSEGKI